MDLEANAPGQAQVDPHDQGPIPVPPMNHAHAGHPAHAQKATVEAVEAAVTTHTQATAHHADAAQAADHPDQADHPHAATEIATAMIDKTAHA